jgi:hypothetical protein
MRDLNQEYIESLGAENAQLKAERDHYKAALEKLAGFVYQGMTPPSFIQIAREALAKEQKP